MDKVAEVLAGLREEEQRLRMELAGVQRAIAALEKVLGVAPPAEPESAPSAAPALVPAPEPPPPGPYAACGLYEAVALYLYETGEPRNAREIAEALRAGGYPTRAKNFTATVRTMLQRHFSAEVYGIRRNETDGRWFTTV